MQPSSSDRKSCGNLLCQFATHWLAVGRYQSIDETIVQLFVPHTSGFMSLQQSDSIGIRITGTWKPLRFLFRSVPPSARPGRLLRRSRLCRCRLGRQGRYRYT